MEVFIKHELLLVATEGLWVVGLYDNKQTTHRGISFNGSRLQISNGHGWIAAHIPGVNTAQCLGAVFDHMLLVFCKRCRNDHTMN